MDGKQAAALANITVGRVDAVVRGGYIKITAVHGHRRALKALIAVRDHDGGYGRVVPLRADGQRVIRVNRVVRGGQREAAARYAHVSRMQRVVRAVNGERAAGDGQRPVRLDALAGVRVLGQHGLVPAVCSNVKRTA